MNIKKTNLPNNSMLNDDDSFEFIDAYKSEFCDVNNKLTICDITKLFFSTSPKWVDKTFEFRNKIVKNLGLKITDKISNRNEMLEKFKCEIDEQIGLFKIFKKSENEIIMGEDDKHLDFRVSLFMDKKSLTEKTLTISTSVKFNNGFGKVYFLPVKPFHKVIVPKMLNGIIKEINKTENCNDR